MVFVFFLNWQRYVAMFISTQAEWAYIQTKEVKKNFACLQDILKLIYFTYIIIKEDYLNRGTVYFLNILSQD